jgi:tetratricopeptide (TPR) repeat protein
MNFGFHPDTRFDNDADDLNFPLNLEDYDLNFKPSAEFPEYTQGELDTDVEFLRPRYHEDMNDVESKTPYNLLHNGFEEVSEGVWSGPWYWRHFGGSIEDAKKKRLKRRQEKLAAHKVFLQRYELSQRDYEDLLRFKKAGNDAFQRKKFRTAIQHYDQAAALIMIGKFLPPNQQIEAINIYSNTAECHLRLQNYLDAIMAATEAILINEKHVKSLYRRAKANYTYAKKTSTSPYDIDLFRIAQVDEDLQMILNDCLAGEEEKMKAQGLLDETKTQLLSLQSPIPNTWHH